MKHVFTASLVAALLAIAAALSVTGAPEESTATGSTTSKNLSIDIQERNPWTHLNVNNDANDIQFAIISDRTGGHRPGVFTRAVKKLNLVQPEFVMSVGDLIEGYSADPGQWALEWAEFESKVEQLKMPFFFCAGNHDFSNLPMSAEWNRKFGRSYYDFRYKDVLFLVLNSEESALEIPNEPPTEEEKKNQKPYLISEAQRNWAVETLAKNQDVRWTFVFLHKPTWTIGANHVELGWATVEDALAGRPYTVFAGHNHVYAKSIRNDREYFILATTGGGSKLTGLKTGEFDHFVWVTMKPDGPQIANLLLDGVEDRNIGLVR